MRAHAKNLQNRLQEVGQKIQTLQVAPKREENQLANNLGPRIKIFGAEWDGTTNQIPVVIKSVVEHITNLGNCFICLTSE